MKTLFWVILACCIFIGLCYLGKQNDSDYQKCVAEGIHTNERCYELAYL